MEDSKKKMSTRNMVILAMLIAIILILGFTPLGMIPIGLFKVTLIHIPVIIGACMLGVRGGAFLGFIFGLVSFLNNSFISPTLTSFVFTPFYTLSDIPASGWSLVVVFVPRIMVGVVSALIYKAIKNKTITLGGTLAGISGALTNTILVFGFIFIFFQSSYESVLGKSLWVVIQAALVTNMIPEVIAAAIIVPLVMMPLEKLKSRQ